MITADYVEKTSKGRNRWRKEFSLHWNFTDRTKVLQQEEETFCANSKSLMVRNKSIIYNKSNIRGIPTNTFWCWVQSRKSWTATVGYFRCKCTGNNCTVSQKISLKNRSSMLIEKNKYLELFALNVKHSSSCRMYP